MVHLEQTPYTANRALESTTVKWGALKYGRNSRSRSQFPRPGQDGGSCL